LKGRAGFRIDDSMFYVGSSRAARILFVTALVVEHEVYFLRGMEKHISCFTARNSSLGGEM